MMNRAILCIFGGVSERMTVEKGVGDCKSPITKDDREKAKQRIANPLRRINPM